MSTTKRFAAIVLLAVFAAAPVAAQSANTDRAFIIGVYGGGYDHIVNLHDAGSGHGTADFTPAQTFGATAGVQLNRYVSLHGDFTFAQNRAEGDVSFAGRRFNRFFYGAHVEAGYPLPGGITPYVFAGGGAVTIDEAGSDATIGAFTKPAGMFGAGFFYALFGRVSLFAEGKQLIYRWDRGGFTPMSLYVPTTEGQVYRVEVSTGIIDRTQFDLTYTLGVSYQLKRGKHTVAAPAPRDDE
jgi:opacity protein-like surface antigen